jgi:hypothetical protein
MEKALGLEESDAGERKEQLCAKVQEAIASAAKIRGGGDDGPGGGDDGPGGGDDDDVNDADEADEEPEDSEGGSSVINVRLPSGEIVQVVVELDDKVKTLKAVIRNKTGIPRKEQRLSFNNEQLEDDSTLSEQNLTPESIVHLQLSIVGGGKRAAGGGAKAKSKAEVLAELTDEVGMTLLRFQAAPHASPAINTIKDRVTLISQMVENGITQNDLAQMMVHLGDKELEKLQTVTSISTRPLDRCREISEVIFAVENKGFREVKTQIKMCEGLLGTAVQLLLISLFADEGGSIGWTPFTKLVGDVVKHKIRAEQAPAAGAGAAPANGLAG